jgi:hypothetical protein
MVVFFAGGIWGVEPDSITWVDSAVGEILTSMVVLLVEGSTEGMLLLGKTEILCESTPLKVALDGTRLTIVSTKPAKGPWPPCGREK